MYNTRKIVLLHARERTLGTRLAVYLVYGAPADKLTKAENTITAVWVVIHVNLTSALSFPFHELHVRSMQI